MWNIPIDDYYLAACSDPYIEYFNKDYKIELGLSNKNNYINAGVLLFNLDNIRKMNLVRECIDILNFHPNIKYQVQDIINIIFKDKILILKYRFNFTINHRSKIKSQHKNKSLVFSELESPIVIYHFVGCVKPWHRECAQSMTEKYQRYIDELCNITPQ